MDKIKEIKLLQETLDERTRLEKEAENLIIKGDFEKALEVLLSIE